MNILLLLGIFTTTVIFTFIIKKYAHKLALIDTPNERSMHKKLIPRGAGIAFVFSIFINLLVFDLEHLVEYYYIYLSISLVWFVGIWDDLRNISPKIKFIFIFVATIILYLNDFAIYSLGTYLGYEFLLPVWMVFPFTFFAMAGYTNALNLMDGLDGLAASISIVMLSAFLSIGVYHNDELLISLSSFFICTLLAFLLFNWHPAKIFMGDSGSLTLGIVIVILSIQSIQYIKPASVLFFIALPLLDTFIVMTRRLQRKGVSLFQADKNHMHHILFAVKEDVIYTVVTLTTMQLVFSIIGHQLRHSNEALSIVLFMLFFYLYLNLFDQRVKRRKK